MLDKDVVSMEWTIVYWLCHLVNQVKSLAYEVVLILDDRDNFGFVWPYPTHISIIFVQTHQNFVLMIVTFLHRYSSRKVASKKVADNIGSQFNVPVEVSYKLTLINFFCGLQSYILLHTVCRRWCRSSPPPVYRTSHDNQSWNLKLIATSSFLVQFWVVL